MKKGFFLFGAIVLLAMNIISAGMYELEFNQVGDKIVIKESINSSENSSYVDLDSLNSAGKEIYFVYKVTFPENFENAKIILNLEKGIVVKKDEIFPLGYKIESDGQTISISWNLSNLKKGDTFAIFVNLEDTKSSASFFLGIFLLAFILIGIFWLIFSKRKKVVVKRRAVKVKKSKESEEYNYLLDTEKKVIEELKKANRHELWQRQIQDLTGFSKAKVSRLVRNLESRGLIHKIPFGNTNKVRLK